MENKALYERFEELLKEFNTTPYGVSKLAKVSQPTLSDWKLGKSEPKRKTLEKICAAYGKNLSYFYNEEVSNEPALTQKDERDITKDLNSIMKKLQSGEDGPASYDGEELSPEAMELFREELEIALKRLKIVNKEKYTPNKYKK